LVQREIPGRASLERRVAKDTLKTKELGHTPSRVDCLEKLPSSSADQKEKSFFEYRGDLRYSDLEERLEVNWERALLQCQYVLGGKASRGDRRELEKVSGRVSIILAWERIKRKYWQVSCRVQADSFPELFTGATQEKQARCARSRVNVER